MSAYDYRIGRPVRTPAGFTRAAVAAAVGFVVLVAATHGEAQSGQSAITCTNTYSGASFQVHVDYDRSTVDSNPARISVASISWQDDKSGRKYILDRNSGNLTVTLASSTGGNFLYDQCKLDK
jgi:hypothetical protein